MRGLKHTTNDWLIDFIFSLHHTVCECVYVQRVAVCLLKVLLDAVFQAIKINITTHQNSLILMEC